MLVRDEYFADIRGASLVLGSIIIRIQEIKPLPGYEPSIGIWLWVFEISRQRALRTPEGFDANLQDRSRPGEEIRSGL